MVFEDANIESAVNGSSVAGIFGASGQSCVAGSRLYLQEGIADQFLDKMVGSGRSKSVIGDPARRRDPDGTAGDAGPARPHIEKPRSPIARAEGATVLHGGRPPGPTSNAGWFYEPTIIDCPAPGACKHRRYRALRPGPQRAPLQDRGRGSSASPTTPNTASPAGIFTGDIGARSHARRPKATRAGIVWVNTYRVVSPIAEFGGFGGSGYGRESGFQAIYDYTRPKTIWVNTSSEPMANPFVMR